jgi:hypothetical protein
MDCFASVLGQRVRLGKGGIMGVKQLLKDTAGPDRHVPLSVWVMRPCAASPAPSLPDPAVSLLALTMSSIASRDFVQLLSILPPPLAGYPAKQACQKITKPYVISLTQAHFVKPFLAGISRLVSCGGIAPYQPAGSLRHQVGAPPPNARPLGSRGRFLRRLSAHGRPRSQLCCRRRL